MNTEILCCPVCKGDIEKGYHCSSCNIKFPIIRNIPVLLNEKNSLFSFDDYSKEGSYSFFGKENKRLHHLRKVIPSTGTNYAAAENYKLFYKLLLKKSEKPLVLIIGGGVTGEGMKKYLQDNQDIEFINTDVSFTPLIQVVCDGHDLPFKKQLFDGVIIQAVLEHVVDPYCCVEEIFNVLKEGGIVYAETPFMQQVHGGAYDFTRFTWLGHRRIFRKFEEIQSGTCCGPGMALAWSWDYFLKSFSSNKKIQSFFHLFSIITSFYLKFFDSYLKKKPNTIDAASGVYFMGYKKADFLLSDKELIKLYDKKKASYR